MTEYLIVQYETGKPIFSCTANEATFWYNMGYVIFKIGK